MQDDDDQLISQIKQQDSEAWERLVARYQGRLYAFALRRLGDRSTAEDIVQETFLGFLVSLPNYQSHIPIESFLFTIAGHKLIDHLRRTGRRITLAQAGSTSDSGISNEPSRDRKVSSMARTRERRQAESQKIANGLHRLVLAWISQGDYERLKSVELAWVRGWSNARVAESIETTPAAVANHKAFTLSKLKQQLGERPH